MRTKHPKYKYIFLVMDFIILTVSFCLALRKVIPDFWAISREHFYFGFNHISFFLLLGAIYLFSFRLNNLYKRNIITSRYRQFVLILKSLLAGTIVAVLFMIFSNMEYFMLHGKNLITYLFLYSAVLFMLFRALLARRIYYFLAKQKISQSRVLIVGGDEAGKYAAGSLQQDPFADFHITGFLDDYKEIGAEINEHYQNLGKLDDLGDIVRDLDVDEILIAIDNTPYERLIHIVEQSLQTGKFVKIYSDLFKVIADKMDVEHYANIPVLELSQYPLSGPAWSDKRILDIVLACFALVILAPLFLAVAIGIKLSSRGPVTFKQVRIGKDGRPFDFYKFRSMHLGKSDSRHKEYVQNFIQNKKKHQCDTIEVFKITDDPRIFKFGKFIRKTSLDEFPQFFNILKGDMSLVGPRPCLPYEWDCYKEWHKKRLTVLPGCTGLWQALGRSSVSFEEMVTLDLYYISNMSLWLDLKIVLQTFPVIFFGKGGH
jgi:exopolysaccharide biosynthesis polyprenyl glycosylphosphotransferase